MKRLFTLLAALLLTASVFAQSPEKMSYQAVIRNSSDVLVTNTQVGMQISILQGTADGTEAYVETQTPTTNANGLVSVEIGDGTVLNGDFSTIDWVNGPYYIKTETDPAGGTSYTITGTSQLLSVPYALHAKTAEVITETDPVYSGSDAANITAVDIVNLSNLSGTNTGDQELSISGNTLSISNGNNVVLPGSGATLPVLTTTEIIALTPAIGDAVFNISESNYQVYNGTSWQAFNSDCWPQPTTANAGNNQEFTDGTTSTTLSANTPETDHGIGQWSILSGEGGSFDDAVKPNAAFTGQGCTTYNLQWTISTSCNSSSDNVYVFFNQQPTTANAGNNQEFTDGTTSTTLSAITPETDHGIGQWSILSGEGGSFDDASKPDAVFTGNLFTQYHLLWTITTDCQESTDEVLVGFYNDGAAGEQVTDIDGNVYNTVNIGIQLWMAENLKVTKQNDGTNIPLVTDNTSWVDLTTPGYCWYDNDQATYGDTYGALYNWYTVETGNLCPAGWHLPSSAEWMELSDHLGGNSVAGGKLKETGTIHWNEPNTGATNESGFAALPGGYRGDDGTFIGIGYSGEWRSADSENSPIGPGGYLTRYISYSGNELGYSGDVWYAYAAFGYSVRCVKD